MSTAATTEKVTITAETRRLIVETRQHIDQFMDLTTRLAMPIAPAEAVTLGADREAVRALLANYACRIVASTRH